MNQIDRARLVVRGLVGTILLSVGLIAIAAGQQLPVKPPPVPTGVIPLPDGAPPTGQQSPVPPPLLPVPKSPLTHSPDLKSIDRFIDGHPVTLQEAIAIALYASPEFAKAIAALQQAEGRSGEVKTSLNPTVSINGELTYYDQATTVNFGAFLGSGAGSGAPTTITITPQFNPIYTGTFALPLDVFGSLRAAASQAQFEAVAAKIDVNRVRNEVVYNVKTAFYQVLRAQALVTVSTDSVNNTLIRLNSAEKTYAAGTAPRFDVISAQRDVANAQQDFISANGQLSTAMAALKNTIGIDIHSHLALSDANAVDYPPGIAPPMVQAQPNDIPTGGNPITPPVATEPVVTPPPSSAPNIPLLPIASPGIVQDTFTFGQEFDDLLAEARKTRPEVLEADAQIAAAQRGIQYSRRSRLPSLNVSLNDVYTPNATGFTRVHDRFIDLSFSVPIWDGGLAIQREKEARAALATQQIGRRQSVDQVQVDVQNAYIALVQARSRVAVANVGLTQAREAFRLARVRYAAGASLQQNVSPQIELSNAQTQLAQAESNQIDALYDYNSARAQIDRAVGRFSFTSSPPGFPAIPLPLVRGSKG